MSIQQPSPLAFYEADEEAGREAFRQGLSDKSCPHQSSHGVACGFNNRRKAWMRGYYGEQVGHHGFVNRMMKKRGAAC